MTKFAEKLKQLRLEKGLSQRALANATNMTQPAIQMWENKIRVPSIDVLFVLAKFFDVSTDYLLGLEDEFGNKI